MFYRIRFRIYRNQTETELSISIPSKCSERFGSWGINTNQGTNFDQESQQYV